MSVDSALNELPTEDPQEEDPAPEAPVLATPTTVVDAGVTTTTNNAVSLSSESIVRSESLPRAGSNANALSMAVAMLMLGGVVLFGRKQFK